MSITRSSIRLIGAGTAVQVLAFLLLPLITYLYDKAEMGVLGTILSVSGLLAIGANGRYEQAIVMAKDGIARLLLIATVFLSFAFSVILIPVLFFFEPILLSAEGYADAVPYLWVVPLLVWLIALSSSFCAIANQQNRYHLMAYGQIAQGLSNNGLKIGLGYAGASIGGLLAATAAGYASMLLALHPWRDLRAVWQNLSIRRMRLACAAYSKFPRYGIFQAIVDTLLGSSLILLMPMQYDMAYVGLVTMAAMVARRPLSVVSDSFGRIYYRHFADLRQANHSMRPAFRKFVFRYLFVAVPSALLLYVAMPWLVRLFMDARWQDSVPLLRWMLPMLIVNFLTAAFNFLPDLFGMQRQHLHVQLMILIAEVITIVVGTWQLPFEQFVGVYYMLEVVIFALYLYWLYRIIVRYERTLY